MIKANIANHLKCFSTKYNGILKPHLLAGFLREVQLHKHDIERGYLQIGEQYFQMFVEERLLKEIGKSENIKNQSFSTIGSFQVFKSGELVVFLQPYTPKKQKTYTAMKASKEVKYTQLALLEALFIKSSSQNINAGSACSVHYKKGRS